ncbi:hypothetical protein HQ545_07345 [Candidatus Woesearchaeota archaeon]|nr:hypothetical protein [Candidatus Woesearchaeota archaeon]
MAETESSKRQIAYKVKIEDVLSGKYVNEDGWLPNYISINDLKVSRVNMLGVVVSVSGSQELVLGDKTGNISLKFFKSPPSVSVGDIVTVIGRPREFGQDRYIVPEIIKKLSDPKWVEVRKKELIIKKFAEAPVEKEVIVTTDDLSDENPLLKVCEIIRSLDEGAGVGFEDISVKFKDGDIESFIKKLLEQGDVFEVKPGRFKVLE